MNRRRRSLALLVMFVALAGCGSASSNSGGSSSAPRDSTPPRVRCLSDPSRDSSSNSRPLIFLFCAESP